MLVHRDSEFLADHSEQRLFVHLRIAGQPLDAFRDLAQLVDSHHPQLVELHPWLLLRGRSQEVYGYNGGERRSAQADGLRERGLDSGRLHH